MYIKSEYSDLASYIKEEIEMEKVTKRGSRGNAVKRVQEWLCYHNIAVVADGIYGYVTEDAVKNFQYANDIPTTGIVDERTFKAFVAPMEAVLENQINQSMPFSQAVAEFAVAHLKMHPREFGGDNRGPWVRLYMKGVDGPYQYWCAGFVSFCMKQAAEALNISLPIQTSPSCDTLAAQAKREGIFVSERDVDPENLPEGSIFLVRNTSTDWTHTGIVTTAGERVFRTIEGNTNDDGGRNGYEVCARSRGYGDKDFIIFN